MGALINESSPPFNVTARAAEKVKELLEKDADSRGKLRVYVTGGGCSGFQYGFEFDQDSADDDMEINSRGVHLLIDPMSFQYLMGAELDFKDDLMGSQFVINNPNATTTCGCGSSFTV